MRKIFIALAASLLITVGSAVRMIQIPASALSNVELKKHNQALKYRLDEEHAQHHANDHWESVEKEKPQEWDDDHDGEYEQPKQQEEHIINAIENALDSTKVNLAVSDKVG